MRNGTNGCVEAVGLMGAGNSPFLADEYNNGQFSVSGLISDAQAKGVTSIPYSKDAAGYGDTILYGDNHAVLSDGAGGYYGNSSSQNQIVHGSDASSMGGLQPTAILKTGTGGTNGNFTYQAHDANGNPFMSLAAHIRTSNPNEAFDQQSIMGILSQPQASYAHEKRMHYLTDRDYTLENLSLPADVAKYVDPYSQQLNANRDADLKASIDTSNQQQKLAQAMQIAQLINGSQSVDNRRGYSALAKMMGIDLPAGEDQFVGSDALLQSQIQMNNADREFDLKQQQQKAAEEMAEKKFNLDKSIAEQSQKIAEAKLAAGGGSGGGSGKGGTKSIGEAKNIVDTIYPLYQGIVDHDRDGTKTQEQIEQEFADADATAEHLIGLMGGDNGAEAYRQVARDNARGQLQSWWGTDYSAGHDWTNNRISRFLGLAGH